MPDQFPLPTAPAENSQENKLFDVKKIKINPNDSFDELTKYLEEGYDIVEKIEYNASQGIVRLYILRKDLSLSNDERVEYERLKKNETEYEQKMAIFLNKFDHGDISKVGLHVVANKLNNFDFVHCYTEKSYMGDFTNVSLIIKVTNQDLYENNK